MALSKKDAMHIYDNRLSSFTAAHQRRLSSTAKRKADPLTWPHPDISIEKLAKAGLFYQPTVGNQDNCVCYLCEKNLAGWEEDDDPALEHAHHAPFCGWARIHAMVVKRNRNKNARVEMPQGEDMLEARKATFGNWWPHKGKGQMPQAEALAKAGFHFYATKSTSTDNVACAYCELELDGWEGGDDPWKEHLKRSEDCLFFTWAEPKKSRASRTSLVPKSKKSATPELASIQSEESILKKKGGRPKKAPTKVSSKKSESVASDVPDASMYEEPEAKPKARGRKRASSISIDMSVEEASTTAPKRARARSTSKARAPRTTRSSISRGQDDIQLEPGVAEQTLNSEAFQEELDDKEIERRLLADLDRPATDEEDAAEVVDHANKEAKQIQVEKREPSSVPDDPDVSIASKRATSTLSDVEDDSIQPPKKRGRVQRTSKASRASDSKGGRTKKQTKSSKAKQEKASSSHQMDTDDVEPATTNEVQSSQKADNLPDADSVQDATDNLRQLRVDPDGGVVLFDGGGDSDSSMGPEPLLVRLKPASTKVQKKAPKPRKKQDVIASAKSRTTPMNHEDDNAPDPELPPVPVLYSDGIDPMEDAETTQAQSDPIPTTPIKEIHAQAVAQYTPPGQIASTKASSSWTAIDIDDEFAALAAAEADSPQAQLTRDECKLTVAEWVKRNASQSETRVMRACENTVNLLHVHSMRALEAVESL